MQERASLSSAKEHSSLISCAEESGFGRNDLCPHHFLLLFLSLPPSWVEAQCRTLPSFLPSVTPTPISTFSCRMTLHSSACSTMWGLGRSREEDRQAGRLVNKGTITWARPPALSMTTLSAAWTSSFNEHVIVEQAKEKLWRWDITERSEARKAQGQHVPMNKSRNKTSNLKKNSAAQYSWQQERWEQERWV